MARTLLDAPHAPLALALALTCACSPENDAGSIYTSTATSTDDEIGDDETVDESNDSVDTTPTGDGDGEPTGDGDGEPTGDGDGDGIKLDTLPPDTDTDTDTGNEDCECGNDEWSYIWISNSAQSTVSKINTATGVEEGRYYTRADQNGNPSRTSVSLGGRAAAVANRNGGVVKIWAREQFCEDLNNNGMIDTSTGAGDIRPWGTDECVAWHRDFPSYNAQRPVAWAGNVNPQNCDDEQLWTSGCGGTFGIDVHLLDGSTGATIDMVSIPQLVCVGFGGYGGAMDPDGNFWIAMNGTGTYGLARITPDMQVDLWAYPAGLSGYGMTVDNKGRPWISSYGSVGIGRFDPETQTWATAGAFTSQGGVQQSEDLRIWVATQNGANGGNGVVVIDPESLDTIHAFAVPGGTVKGISLDMQGYLWAVTGGAYRYDTNTYQLDLQYNGLTGPYTYSDMTGWGLQNANCNPPVG